MSMITADAADFWRSLLFYLEQPVTISKAEFEVFWPLVSHVYTYRKRYQGEAKETMYYDCRLAKSKPSSTRKADIKTKRRNRPSRMANQCQCTIKVVHQGNSVKLERTSEHGHQHDIRASDQIKVSPFVRDIVENEISRGFKPGDIMESIHGNGQVFGPNLKAVLMEAGAGLLSKKSMINMQTRVQKRVNEANNPMAAHAVPLLASQAQPISQRPFLQ